MGATTCLFRFLCDEPPATDPLALALYRSCRGGGAMLLFLQDDEYSNTAMASTEAVMSPTEISGGAG